MRRYQVYLNSNSVAVLDDFEKISGLSRSKIIREAIDRLAQNLSRVFVAKNIQPQNKLILDSLVGFINLKNKRQTNYASQDDNKYLAD